ncbi:MAG: hypothetical protein QW702_08725 [Candidatus Bathyarchaeia archaeon]
MPKVMPFSLQVKKAESYIRKHGLDPHAFDLKHELDPKLSFTENMRKVKRWVKAKHDDLGEMIRGAYYTHKQRSERAQRLDEKRRAKKVAKERARDIPIIEKWFKYPNKYDIENIDAFSFGLRKKRGKGKKGKARRGLGKLKRKLKLRRRFYG